MSAGYQSELAHLFPCIALWLVVVRENVRTLALLLALAARLKRKQPVFHANAAAQLLLHTQLL